MNTVLFVLLCVATIVLIARQQGAELAEAVRWGAATLLVCAAFATLGLIAGTIWWPDSLVQEPGIFVPKLRVEERIKAWLLDTAIAYVPAAIGAVIMLVAVSARR